jgi:hypothetical protein
MATAFAVAYRGHKLRGATRAVNTFVGTTEEPFNTGHVANTGALTLCGVVAIGLGL